MYSAISHNLISHKCFGFKKWILLSFFVSISCLLSACSDQKVDAFWQGQWQREVPVPEGLQGRCYDEILQINKKEWILDVTIHSTFECDQPFLALQFSGRIDEILISKKNKNHKMSLSIRDIHLTGMADIAANSRVALSEDAVQRLSRQYVPNNMTEFSQNMSFNQNKTRMLASLYTAAEMIAIPQAADLKRTLFYSRIK